MLYFWCTAYSSHNVNDMSSSSPWEETLHENTFNIHSTNVTIEGVNFDLQTLFPSPFPLGPVGSAYWQLRTEPWRSGPPLHRPGWGTART